MSGGIRRFLLLAVLTCLSGGILYLLSVNVTVFHRMRGSDGFVPAVGNLLDPYAGLLGTARQAASPGKSSGLPGMTGDVTIVRDDRNVPHIFAASLDDAIRATGYVVAEDRLFQLDFLPRVASGRLAAVLGAGLVDTDRYLRSTGMEWGAARNYDRILSANGRELQILRLFSEGVNLYLEALEPRHLPVEFRLLGYEPEPYTPMHTLRLLQYMSYDLSFETDAIDYGKVRSKMSASEYEKLFPAYSSVYVPIFPHYDDGETKKATVPPSGVKTVGSTDSSRWIGRVFGARVAGPQIAPGFKPGKGSNNWAVSGKRSATGTSILAGDMHLSLTLPAIWYEIHIVTPTLNTYGVTIPGSPLIVEGFTDRTAWAFTNTGADQIDHYLLEENEDGSAYRFEDKWLDYRVAPDTIEVRGEEAAIGALRFSRFGPVLAGTDPPVAIRWTAHDTAQTLLALEGMQRATNESEFQDALRRWHSPVQNILFADMDGTISMRSTGRLPIRKSGTGAGLLDGSSADDDWVGMIPFDELPYARDPGSGYLTSTNQQPAGRGYPHYLGHDWYRSYRSIRIDSLLRSREAHSVQDLLSYQADVYVVQMELFRPFLRQADGLSRPGAEIKAHLMEWDGRARVDAVGPLLLIEFLNVLKDLAWDEFDREEVRRPRESQLYWLLRYEPDSEWLDIRATDLMIETGPDLIRLAIEATADSIESKYGWGKELWRWGDHHTMVFRHLTRSEALRPMWRGPHEAPGFASTLAPAEGLTTTFGASWRMVVDFSSDPPKAVGVYPGGQSGNPASRFYDMHIPAYLRFDYFPLRRPKTADAVRGPIARYQLSALDEASDGESSPDDSVGNGSGGLE